MNANKLTAQFEFTESGYLKAIFLNAGSEKDQAMLEKALNRLLNPDHFRWIRRLFRKK